MRIGDIRPQHLNKLYESLAQPEARVDNETAAPTPRLWKEVARRGLTSCIPGPDGGRISLSRLRKGQTVRPATAERIAKALGLPKTALFYPVREEKRLSGRTIMNCHALVAGILAQAEREMLIPFNPARRATPPKKEASAPNYYQPEEVGQILQALAGEPLKWRAAVHLLLVSGCRRGELLGLKWNKVDWDQGAVRIDCALLYARDRGIYEGSPKTRDSVRTIRLPEETMLLLAEYRRWQSQQRLLLGPQWKDSPYVFTGERGRPHAPLPPGQLAQPVPAAPPAAPPQSPRLPPHHDQPPAVPRRGQREHQPPPGPLQRGHHHQRLRPRDGGGRGAPQPPHGGDPPGGSGRPPRRGKAGQLNKS